MTAAAIWKFLPEFDALADPRRGGRRDAQHSVTGKALVEEAFAAGRAAAEVEFGARQAEQQARAEQLLADARAAWVQQEGARLAGQIAAGLQEIEQQVASAVARTLQPFLGEALRRQAVAGLLECLDTLLARDPGMSVSISGAPDLVAALRAGLEGKAADVTCHAAETSDVRIAVGQSVLEARLGAWMAEIGEAQR